MTVVWRFIEFFLSKIGICISYCLAIGVSLALEYFHMPIPKKILGTEVILSVLLAFIAFIFSVRTFLIFKLKDLYDNPKEQELFRKFKQEGICPLEKDYYEELKMLDQYFNNVLYSLSIATIIIIIIKIAEAFCQDSPISSSFSFLLELLGIVSVIIATMIILLSGHITNNIVRNMQLEPRK